MIVAVILSQLSNGQLVVLGKRAQSWSKNKVALPEFTSRLGWQNFSHQLGLARRTVWQDLLPMHQGPRILHPVMAVVKSPPTAIPPGQWIKLQDIASFVLPHGAILNQALGKLWPMFAQGYRSPQFRAKFELPVWMAKTKFKAGDELIFFGGSFNPWHNGHQACVKLCHKALPQGKIIIVPDHNPWKKFTPQLCYWEQLRSLGRRLARYPFSIYPGFYGMEQEHPTVSWLLAHEGKKKSFLIGDDNLLSFLSWQQAPALLQHLYRLIIVPRTATPEQRAQHVARLRKYNPRLKFLLLPNHPYRKIASSKMRH